MKTNRIILQIALATALLTGALSSAQAQATVRFANDLSSGLTNGLTNERLPLGAGFLVSLYAAPPGLPGSAFVLIAGPIGLSGQPGLYDGGNVPVPGLLPGQLVTLQVRAWDSRGGTIPSFEAAAATPSTLIGTGPPYTVPVGSNTRPPTGTVLCCSSGSLILSNCPVSRMITNSSTTNVTVIYPLPTATGGCGTATVTCHPPPGSTQSNNTSVTYTCRAAGSCSSTPVTCTFTVTVGVPPVITIAPTSTTALAGTTATFNVTATGTSPLQYQWFFNGQAIPGATNTTFTIASATTANEGNYHVVVSNPFGVASSQNATLMVLTTPNNGTLISTGAFWRYRFNGLAPDSNWRTRNYNDDTWPGGRAQLGFGDGDEATVIGHATNQFITAYFRRAFLIPNATAASHLFVALRRDDGGIVYLNGVEVFRSNMPTGAVNHLTLAPEFDPADGAGFHIAPISPGAIVVGTNQVAVEVHQQNATSSDLSFDLQLVSLPPSVSSLQATRSGSSLVLSWNDALYRLQSTAQLRSPASNTVWSAVPGRSPLTNAPLSLRQFYRLIWP